MFCEGGVVLQKFSKQMPVVFSQDINYVWRAYEMATVDSTDVRRLRYILPPSHLQKSPNWEQEM